MFVCSEVLCSDDIVLYILCSLQDQIINAMLPVLTLCLFVFCVVPDPFNYITFFGLRKHEEMCNRLVCIVSYTFIYVHN